MPYSSISKCRFYVNVIEWLGSSGYINFGPAWNTLPVDVSNSWTSIDLTSYNIGTFFKEGTSTKYPNGQNFLALLGHTCATDGADVFIHQTDLGDVSSTEVINRTPFQSAGYNGFSIVRGMEDLIYESSDWEQWRPYGVYRIYANTTTSSDFKVACY